MSKSKWKHAFVIDGASVMDDRGYVSFVNDFNFQDVKRFYIVENHDNLFVRAWHGHKKEDKYVIVVSGRALVATVPMDSEPDNNILMEKFYLSDRKPQILHIPPGHYNGFMNLVPNTRLMFMSTSTLEESKEDDFRMPWNTWNAWEQRYR